MSSASRSSIVLEVAVVDAADVAEHVRSEAPSGILAEQSRLDLDAGKAVAVGDEARHLLVGQAGADRQRLEVLAFLQQLAEALAVLRLDVEDLGQFVDDVSSRSCTLRA